MALENISALILDDNANMRGLLRIILNGFGLRSVNEAQDAASALFMLAEREFDIAFVDFKLGGVDGLDFCRGVRSGRGGVNIYLPIIMVSAYSERAKVLHAINAGVDEFLVKPVRAVDVAKRVNAIVERRRPFIRTTSYFGPDRRRRPDPTYRGPWRRAGDKDLVDV